MSDEKRTSGLRARLSKWGTSSSRMTVSDPNSTSNITSLSIPTSSSSSAANNTALPRASIALSNSTAATAAAADPTLVRILEEMRNPSISAEELVRFAGDLRVYVDAALENMHSEAFARFMAELNRRLFDFVGSLSEHERLCGISIINALIDFQYEENEKQIERFSKYLGMLLEQPLSNQVSPADSVLLKKAAKAVGDLSRSGGSLVSDFVEKQVKNSLSWLEGDRVEHKRFAATLVLKQLAIDAPTMFIQYIASFLDHIWVAIRDPKEFIRKSATEAVRSFLKMIQDRELKWRFQLYFKLYNEVQKGISSINGDSAHGSFLVIGELLELSGDFMLARFKECCNFAITLKDHKSQSVRQIIIELLPRLCRYCPFAFIRGFLEESLRHIISTLQIGQLKETGFLALGSIAQIVGQSLSIHLNVIMDLIDNEIETNGKSGNASEALQCLGLLSQAVGPALHPYVTEEFLHIVFKVKLSVSAMEAWTKLALNIPGLLSRIQQEIMNAVTMILGKNIEFPIFNGHSSRSKSVVSRKAPQNFATIESNADADPELIALSMKCLTMFDLQSRELLGFVREVIAHYLDHEDPRIRTQAALTVNNLLLAKDGSDEPKKISRDQISLINELIERILVIAIGDSNSSVRLKILESFDDRFNSYLVQPFALSLLFSALKDEACEVRCASMAIIGKVATINPGYVMPTLRKTLLQLITILQFSNDLNAKEESAILIRILISSSEELIRPYIPALSKTLLPLINLSDSAASSAAMTTFKTLAVTAGYDMRDHLLNVIPLIVSHLQDQLLSSRRDVALRTLGQVIQSTGCVTQPYFDYVDLLPNLLSILKTEQNWEVRKEAAKVIGIVGALDPYKFRKNERIVSQKRVGESAMITKNFDIISSEENSSDKPESAEEGENIYHASIAMESLISILKDSGLVQHHSNAISALMFIMNELQHKAVLFSHQTITILAEMLKQGEESFRCGVINSLSDLVLILKASMRPYWEAIFFECVELWNLESLQSLKAVLRFARCVSLISSDDFQTFLPRLIPKMLYILSYDHTANRLPSYEVIDNIEVLCSNLLDYLDLIIVTVVNNCEMSDAPIDLRKRCINVISRLASLPNFKSYTSRIVHPFIRIISSSTPSFLAMRDDIIEAFCVFVVKLQTDFSPFIPTIEKALNKIKHPAAKYRQLVSNFLRGINFGGQDGESSFSKQEEEFAKLKNLLLQQSVRSKKDMDIESSEKLGMNQSALKKIWDTSGKSSKDDWLLWLKNFSIQLVKFSPSVAIRTCQQLVQKYSPLARDLFNVAFASCWVELRDVFQDDLLRNVIFVFKSSSVPSEVLQILLNLVEFMERNGNPLPIPLNELGNIASSGNAYAKALFYKETEMQYANARTIEDLISINNQLQLPDAAEGILNFAQKSLNIELKETWYEKLQQWDAALESYERKQLLDPSDTELTLGRLRCLSALAEWERLSVLSRKLWEKNSEEISSRSKIAEVAIKASWNLGNWKDLKLFLADLDSSGIDHSFYSAVLGIIDNQFERASKFIDICRQRITFEFSALLGESYDRAYKYAVQIQQLTELEEVIAYKITASDEKRLLIRKVWNERLRGCQQSVDIWQQILSIRSLVVSPKEDINTWIHFSNLCRKHGRLNLSSKTLFSLLEPELSSEHRVILSPYVLGNGAMQNMRGILRDLNSQKAFYDFCKHLWTSYFKDTAQERLEFLEKEISISLEQENRSDELVFLSGRCNVRLAQWTLDCNDVFSNEELTGKVSSYFKKAMSLNPNYFRAIHHWSLFNYQLVEHYEQNSSSNSEFLDENSSEKLHAILAATQGFFRALDLDSHMKFQDTLRLLSLCFKYGNHPKIDSAFQNGFDTISIDTWLSVIPQLIARINSNKPQVRRLIHDVLQRIGLSHPQALIYPLTVASKSNVVSRKSSASNILKSMKKHSEKLVEQAELVSFELIRTAVLWQEMWFEGLETASNCFYSSTKNIIGMFDALLPLHEMMSKGAETLSELAFIQSYGKELQEAKDWMDRYRLTKEESCLNEAWRWYISVYRKIDGGFRKVKEIQLQQTSPALLKARNLELAVPGTYFSKSDIITIEYFYPSMRVLTSKQRPRKLNLRASNGKDYPFLLKGHEDLRQDERVMQLFSLVNALISSDRLTSKKDLHIRGYAVVPLSPSSGLIEWLGQCDTLNDLIQEYRNRKRILVELERLIMMNSAPEKQLQSLTVIQMVDVLEQAQMATKGQDIQAMLWLKSQNSEIWLDRRTNYIRSLAAMSMVGYILGLGDRHPCNLMLDRTTGKIIHIDFGDCFEVACLREKFPEKVPFRLTRMLINAMEVSGIEGSFRRTCENVLRVLRENKESVLAVLEAFIHDPLISWRLLNTDNDQLSLDLDVGFYNDSGEMENQKKGNKVMSSFSAQGSAVEEDSDSLNESALHAMNRVKEKLTGRDFEGETLDIQKQVSKLILQATAPENLAQCWIGWCPFW